MHARAHIVRSSEPHRDRMRAVRELMSPFDMHTQFFTLSSIAVIKIIYEWNYRCRQSCATHGFFIYCFIDLKVLYLKKLE